MLILNKDLWETDQILKVHSSDDWESAESALMLQCTLDEIKNMFENNTGRPAVLILDCNKGVLPPLSVFMKVFKLLLTLRKMLAQKLNFTILYVKKEEDQQTVNNILKLYKSVRPIMKARSNDDIRIFMKRRDIMEAEMKSFDEIDEVDSDEEEKCLEAMN